LDIMQALIRDIWAARVGGQSSQSAEIAELAERADAGIMALWLKDIEEIRANMAVNINKKIAADALLVRMAAS